MSRRRLFFIFGAISMAIMLTVLACTGGSNINLAGKENSPAPAPEGEVTSKIVPISLEEALTSGKPTLAELGSTSCIPCKEMRPILEQLAVEYKDRLNVVIVDVYESQESAQKYAITVIPTQIFFDSSGEIIAKHIGLLPKEDIIAQLKKMGVE
ncbi:MAG: thioredoxin family protein [Chloroflexota bacterium]